MATLDGFMQKLQGLNNNPDTTPVAKGDGSPTNFTLTSAEYKELMNDYGEMRPKDLDRLWANAEEKGENLELFDALDQGLPYVAYLKSLDLEKM